MASSVYDPKAPRRTYGCEAEFLPIFQEVGHRVMRAAFIELGVTAQLAGNLVWFLDDQVELDRHLSESTRTRLRSELAKYDPAEVLATARAIGGLFNSGALAA
jgi:hypothetical protein